MYGTVPRKLPNKKLENQEPNEDRSQYDPHPEVGSCVYQSRHSKDSNPVEDSEIVTGVEEGTSYCSHVISSGKQKKARSTSQFKFHSQKTPATVEVDQNLLALQQLVNKSNSANSHNNINRDCKLLNVLTTTMPTFDEKSENVELFENLFETSLIIHK